MSNFQAVANFDLTTRNRIKVYCYCKICNGKLVDPRTKKNHELKYNNSYTNSSGNNYQEVEEAGNNLMECKPVPEINVPLSDIIPLSNITGQAPEVAEPLFEKTYSFLTKKVPIHESEKSQKTKKGKISDLVLENLLPNNERNKNDDQDKGFDDSDGDGDSESYEEDNDSEDFEYDDEDNDAEDFEDDDDEIVNFASTNFEDREPSLPNINIDDNYTWIILWILRYQQRFKLSNVAIDSLFNFLKLFLLTIDENKFLSFPSSLYLAKKSLGISMNIIKYAACNKCHKLYDINELSKKTEITTCSFINYPNHNQERFRQKCNNPLVKKIDSSKDSRIFRSIMTFPLVNIKQQLTLFFGRKNFEVACRKWAERRNETEALFDIYDGNIWKNFKDEHGELFFTKECADTHIGMMLNMDWFQPFVNSQYSVGVIYAVICNLPRNERFKPYNTLTLAVIPSPKELKLHGINNYLYPIINQLNQLWEGYHIKMNEYSNGQFIRGAIIGYSCDVPTSRKLCGFISARIACYRYYKLANFVNNQPNFGGLKILTIGLSSVILV